jgi:TRAP-type C4-dicarboxylate transport system substrate-binding protein
MTKFNSWIAALCGATALCALAAAPGLAQEKFTLRFNHVHSPTEPNAIGFTKWAKAVEARTKGGLKMEVFHSAQLGVEEDIIEQIRQGAAIGQNTDAARLGNYVPQLAVVNGPYFVESKEEAFKLGDLETIKKWEDELATKQGIKVVCSDWVQGKRNFYTNKPVRKPEDLSSLRIRTPPAPIWQESIRALGASPTAMSFGEIYPGLQQQAIDGAELVYPNITAGNLNEVLKYANETGHITLINFEVVSSAWFNKLPAEYQTALVEECRTAGREASAAMEEAGKTDREKLKSRGMTIVSDVDLAAFKAAGEKAYEKLNLKAARDQIYKELGR